VNSNLRSRATQTLGAGSCGFVATLGAGSRGGVKYLALMHPSFIKLVSIPSRLRSSVACDSGILVKVRVKKLAQKHQISSSQDVDYPPLPRSSLLCSLERVQVLLQSTSLEEHSWPSRGLLCCRSANVSDHVVLDPVPILFIHQGNIKQLYAPNSLEFHEEISQKYGPVVRVNGMFGVKSSFMCFIRRAHLLDSGFAIVCLRFRGHV